jgi:hypothetical protein
MPYLRGVKVQLPTKNVDMITGFDTKADSSAFDIDHDEDNLVFAFTDDYTFADFTRQD